MLLCIFSDFNSKKKFLADTFVLSYNLSVANPKVFDMVNWANKYHISIKLSK